MRPKTKLTVPATTDAVGRTIFGNWIWRIRLCRPVTESGRVAQGGREPLPGQDGREDEQRVVRCLAVEDDRHEDDVDGHLEQRVEDPPELPEQGVRMGPLEVGPNEVTGQSPTPEDLAEAGPDQREGVHAPASPVGGGDRLGGDGRHERP